MRWLGDRESENVEDRRSGVGGGAIGLGGGVGAIILVLAGLYFGVDPSTLIALLNGDQTVQSTQMRPTDDGGRGSSRPPEGGAPDPMRQFVAVVLADTEDVWQQIFQGMGKTYVDPKLVLYSNMAPSACGLASTASGPFYCPNDQKAYLDLSFFEEMKSRFHASGEFAEAYVIAHEIGHHVQNQLGILEKANAERARSDQRRSNAIRCGLNCRRTALPGCGPITPTAPSTSSNKAMSRRLSTPPARWGTTGCSARRRAPWCPTLSPMALRINESAGSSAASIAVTSRRATPSRRSNSRPDSADTSVYRGLGSRDPSGVNPGLNVARQFRQWLR